MREIPVRDPPAGEWPAGELESPGGCPVCGGSMRERLHDDARDRIFFCAPGRWTLWRCAECRSAYLDPRPAASAIGRAYRGYYTHGGDMPDRPPTSVRNWLQAAVLNDYLRFRLGFRRSPRLPLGRFLLYGLGPTYARLAARWVRHLPFFGPDALSLDLGCGNGDFLEVARACGRRVEGLELDPDAAGVARRRGCVVHVGGLPATGLPTATYDAISLNHVIEHVHDPVSALREVRRILKPGGWVWIATPNIDALGYRRFGVHWFGLDPPRHLVLFNGPSLAQALARAGFGRVVTMPAQLRAFKVFRTSERVSRGWDPHEPGARMSWRIRLSVIWAALRTGFNPELTEELIVMAQRAAGTLEAEGHEESRTQPGEELDRVSCARTEPAEDETERD